MKPPGLHRRPLKIELAFHTQTIELFIYYLDYLLLPMYLYQLSFVPQPGPHWGSREVELPSEYGNPLVL